MDCVERALAALEPFSPEERLEICGRRLTGELPGPLGEFPIASELAPTPDHLDGRLLEAIASRAMDGARGAVFTSSPEAHLLAGLGMARAAARRGVPEQEALAALLGHAPPEHTLVRALEGIRLLDPCCGAGALLAAALGIARRCGFEPILLGLDVAPLAVRAARWRLNALAATSTITHGDALAVIWPDADLVLANPPFLRHEALTPAEKDRAVARSGLPRQADLSAHLSALALRHAQDVALVWPRALDTSRSAARLVADARARGGFPFRLRSRVTGSFAASVDTLLAVWSHGHPGRPDAEASVPLGALGPQELIDLSTGTTTHRLRALQGQRPEPRTALRVADVCEVRFGLKSGCNGFFHLRPGRDGRFQGGLVGEVVLGEGDVQPILASLKEAQAPELVAPSRFLFRPTSDTPTARAHIARGQELGVSSRPTCAGRSPWWVVSAGRVPAPVLYPAKVGARAFAVHNVGKLWEDKKWHALFPKDDLEPWLLALILGATPIRLAVDRAARQLTGMQAIADIDCRVLSAAPFPTPRALGSMRDQLFDCHVALARDPVTTEIAAMLARPAQEELDRLVGHALGFAGSEVDAVRCEMADRIASRLEHAAHVRRLAADRA